jgi:hypothetical protein
MAGRTPWVSLVAMACTTADPSDPPEAAAPDTEQAGAPDAELAAIDPDPDAEPDAASDKELIEGKFDVGGHELYLNCRGAGDPTIIYLHGSIENPAVVPHGNGLPFQARLGDEHRVCVSTTGATWARATRWTPCSYPKTS